MVGARCRNARAGARCSEVADVGELGDGRSTIDSNVGSGTDATRRAVSFWRGDRPASRAACDREICVGADVDLPPPRSPPIAGAICLSSSPHRRIARALIRCADSFGVTPISLSFGGASIGDADLVLPIRPRPLSWPFVPVALGSAASESGKGGRPSKTASASSKVSQTATAQAPSTTGTGCRVRMPTSGMRSRFSSSLRAGKTRVTAQSRSNVRFRSRSCRPSVGN